MWKVRLRLEDARSARARRLPGRERGCAATRVRPRARRVSEECCALAGSRFADLRCGRGLAVSGGSGGLGNDSGELGGGGGGGRRSGGGGLPRAEPAGD